MNQKIETYCELEFLKSFFEDLLAKDFGPASIPTARLKKYRIFKNIIFENLNIFIDSFDEFVELSNTNPLFKYLLKGDSEGRSRIDNIIGDFHLYLSDEEYVVSLPPSTVHLYQSDLEFYVRNNSLGYLINHPDWIPLVDILKLNKEIGIRKGESPPELKNWAIIGASNKWINAAVIVDPYFTGKSSLLKENLYKMLTALLPESLDIDFHLSIVTNMEGEQERTENRYNQIREFLDHLAKPYNIEFGLYDSARIHDRHIFTNYFRIDSLHSFDYYNEKGVVNKDTTLSIKGLLGTENNQHFNLLSDLKKKLVSARIGFDHFGSKNNRLFR